jgi:hypothetical protein
LLAGDTLELETFRRPHGLDLGSDLDAPVQGLPKTSLLPSGVHRAFGQPRHGRVDYRQALGQLHRLGLEVGAGDHTIDQPDRDRRCGVDPVVACEHQFLGSTRPYQPWEHVGDDCRAELDLGLTEEGVVGGHDQVAHHHEVAPACQTMALDHGDHRLRLIEHLEQSVETPIETGPSLVVAAGGAFLVQVVPGAKRPAGAAEDDHVHGLVVGSVRQFVGQCSRQLRGECIELLGSVEREGSHRAVIGSDDQ